MTWTSQRIRLAGLFSVLLLATLLAWMPFIRHLDLKLLDTNFEAKRSLRPTQAPGVVLIGVDEATEKAFPEPLVLWHKHFEAVFRGLATGKAKGVGVDFNPPMKPFDSLIPGIDACYMRGIIALRLAGIPLVLGVTIDADFRQRKILPMYEGAAGDNSLAYVLWDRDRDQYIRYYDDDRIGSDGKRVPTLAGTLARRLGYPTNTGYIDYSYGESLPYVPFHRVAAWSREGNVEALRKTFEGKVILIGSVLPNVDRHFIPVNLASWEESHNYVPGVLFHVQAMRCFMGPGLIKEIPWFVRLGAGLLSALILWMLSGSSLRGTIAVVAAIGGILALEYFLLDQRWFLPGVGAMGGALLGFTGRVGLESGLKLQERWRLKRVFAGYVSPSILKEIVDGRIHPGLTGERRAICLVFSDIRSFTTLSEHLEPEEVIAILNRYFDRMAEAIHSHGGTLDKFLGDGIMAFFGAPEPMENPCRKGFEAAKAMLAALDKLNEEWASEGRAPLKIGIGLHYGPASVGHVGSQSRHEYTAIGDAVNVASRVEGLTKEVGYPMVLTDTVVQELGMPQTFDSLGDKPLKGRKSLAVFGWPPRSNPDSQPEERP